MNQRCIIGGNHLIDATKILLEEKPLSHSMYILHEDDDLILFFDQINVNTFSLVEEKNLPLIPVRKFFRKNELPELPDNSFIIVENTLRNYSNKIIKSGKESILKMNMFNELEDGHIKCVCYGIVLSLIEILNKKYEEIIFIAEKDSLRLKPSDLIKVKNIIPNIKLIWV